MRNLLKRLKNLWKLSSFEIPENEDRLVITKKGSIVSIEKPKMAQIIKRTSPTEEFLKNDE